MFSIFADFSPKNMLENNPPQMVPSWIYMEVSSNGGTPKSSILIGFFHYKPSIWGYHHFRKHPHIGETRVWRRQIYNHVFTSPSWDENDVFLWCWLGAHVANPVFCLTAAIRILLNEIWPCFIVNSYMLTTHPTAFYTFRVVYCTVCFHRILWWCLFYDIGWDVYFPSPKVIIMTWYVQ